MTMDRYTITTSKTGAREQLVDTLTGAVLDQIGHGSPAFEAELQGLRAECDAKNGRWRDICARSDQWREQQLTEAGRAHYAAWVAQGG